MTPEDVQEFCDTPDGFTSTIEYQGETTRDGGWECRTYGVTLHYQGRDFSMPFYCGIRVRRKTSENP